MTAYCACGECRLRDMLAGVVPVCFIDLRDSSALLADLMGIPPEATDADVDFGAIMADARRREGRPLDPSEEWLRHLDGILAKANLSPRMLAQARELADELRARGLSGLSDAEVAALALRARRRRATIAALRDTSDALTECSAAQSTALLDRLHRLAQLANHLA